MKSVPRSPWRPYEWKSALTTVSLIPRSSSPGAAEEGRSPKIEGTDYETPLHQRVGHRKDNGIIVATTKRGIRVCNNCAFELGLVSPFVRGGGRAYYVYEAEQIGGMIETTVQGRAIVDRGNSEAVHRY